MGRDKDASDAPSSFDDVFEDHHRWAWRLAYLLCGDAAVAEDAAAEAFGRVYVQWRRGRIEDVAAYVRKAVVNEVRAHFRRRLIQRRERPKLVVVPGGRSHEDAAADRDVLWRALRRLPTRQRAAIVLRYYEDLTEAATADLLGTSVGTVKAHVSRGLDRLRDLLTEEEER